MDAEARTLEETEDVNEVLGDLVEVEARDCDNDFDAVLEPVLGDTVLDAVKLLLEARVEVLEDEANLEGVREAHAVTLAMEVEGEGELATEGETEGETEELTATEGESEELAATERVFEIVDVMVNDAATLVVAEPDMREVEGEALSADVTVIVAEALGMLPALELIDRVGTTEKVAIDDELPDNVAVSDGKTDDEIMEDPLILDGLATLLVKVDDGAVLPVRATLDDAQGDGAVLGELVRVPVAFDEEAEDTEAGIEAVIVPLRVALFVRVEKTLEERV
jgi:hypothetical protein